MRQKFEAEVARLAKFQSRFFGAVKSKTKQIDPKNYAKYLLKEGRTIEKREHLSCIKTNYCSRKKY